MRSLKATHVLFLFSDLYLNFHRHLLRGTQHFTIRSLSIFVIFISAAFLLIFIRDNNINPLQVNTLVRLIELQCILIAKRVLFVPSLKMAVYLCTSPVASIQNHRTRDMLTYTAYFITPRA